MLWSGHCLPHALHLLAAADGFMIVYCVDDWKSFQVAETRRECEKMVETRVEHANSRHAETVSASRQPLPRRTTRAGPWRTSSRS